MIDVAFTCKRFVILYEFHIQFMSVSFLCSCGLPVTTSLLFLGIDSSPTPTSILPRNDSALYSSAYDLPFVVYEEVVQKLLQISSRFFADFQRFLHLNVSDFSAEACASKENSGPCEICGFHSLINGNETCLIFTIGSCDEEVKR